MTSHGNGRLPMTAWCPLIPPDYQEKFVSHEEYLVKVNNAYDDWRSSMRGKTFVGVRLGVLLDRIRMLMINVGIACGQKRDLAESIQSVVSDRMRQDALRLVSGMATDTDEQTITKTTLENFFSDLRFTRDIFPIEEIRKAIPKKSKGSTEKRGLLARLIGGTKDSGSAQIDIPEDLDQIALQDATNIIKRLYMRLLSLDPWGTS